MKRALQHCRVGGAHLMQSLLVRESNVLLQILHHIVFPFCNSHVQTCSAYIGFVKLVLTKSWKKVFHHIKVPVTSSKV